MARFSLKDQLKIHVLNNYLSNMKVEKSLSAPHPFPDVPLMYHAVTCQLNEGQYSTLTEILGHVEHLRHWSYIAQSDPNDKLVTFDDGYRSSLEAIKALANQGVPVTWFVPSWCLEHLYLPKDAIYIVLKHLQRGEQLRFGTFHLRFCNESLVFRRWLAYKLNHALLQHADRQTYLQVLTDFTHEYRTILELGDDELLRLVSLGELRALLDRYPKIRIGAHGASHYRWDRLTDAKDIAEELERPARELEQALGRPVDEVAYPYGLRPKHLMGWIRRLYQRGYLAQPIVGGDDYSLPRLGMDGKHITVHT